MCAGRGLVVAQLAATAAGGQEALTSIALQYGARNPRPVEVTSAAQLCRWVVKAKTHRWRIPAVAFVDWLVSRSQRPRANGRPWPLTCSGLKHNTRPQRVQRQRNHGQLLLGQLRLQVCGRLC